jgi:hypothetical protein
VPDDDHAPPVIPREPADDGRVVPEAPIAVQLLPVLEEKLDVVERVGAVRVARELDLLPRAEIGEELASEAARLLLEATQLGLEVVVRLGELAELLDPRDQLDDRLLEGEDVRGQAATPRPWWQTASRASR